MVSYQRIFFSIMFYCLLSRAFAADIILLDSDQSAQYTFENVLYFIEDTSGSIGNDLILSGSLDQLFQPSPTGSLNYGVTSSVIWVRFTAQNESFRKNPKWFLYLDYPLFDFIEIYGQNSAGEWIKTETGDRHPFSIREFAHRSFVLPLDMPDNDGHTYYMKFATSGSMQITPSLYTEAAFVSDNSLTEVGYGFFFGALVIMMLYNLFLFLSLKDIAYLAYVLFILNSILLQSAYSGHLTQYILGEYPYWANQVIPIFMALTSVTTAYFSLTFLHTARFAPILHKALIAIIVLGLIHVGTSFFIPISKGIPIAGLLVMVCLVVVISAGVASYRHGNKSARYYLLAWSVLVLFGLIQALRLFGILSSNFLTIHGVHVANLMEVVLLAMALADKYNIFKKEKEEAQEEVLMMQKEANLVLEARVNERTLELANTNDQLNDSLHKIEIEKKKSDNLLLNILPVQTANELKETGKAVPRYYDQATVLFTDFKNFTSHVEKLTPEEVILILGECFLAFDEICEKYNLEKIKTIGDSYMAAGGLPLPNKTNPSDAIRTALEIQKWMNTWQPEKISPRIDEKWEIRIGIHTGPIVAGVVGKKKFAYDIWGDAVNIASRMETAAQPGEVTISKATYHLVKDQFDCEYKGTAHAKNKGEIELYWVKGEKVS